MKYRKKPAEVEAIRYTGHNKIEVREFTAGQALESDVTSDLRLRNPEGDFIVRQGDYIICDVSGAFYPCHPELFEETHEPVKE